MKKRWLFLILLLCTVAPAHAKKLSFEYDYPAVSDRWGVEAGGFIVDLDTEAAVGFGNVVGTTFDLEDVLDLETNQRTWRLEGFYRFAPRHTVEFGLFQINRTASTSIIEPIDFNGYRFEGNLDSTYDMSQFKTIYKYSFLNNGQVNAGFSAGLSTFRLEGSLEGNAELLDDQGMPVGSYSPRKTSETLLAPVPALGMFVEYAPWKWFVLSLEGQFFNLQVSDLEFRYNDTRILADFYFTRHVALGVGLNRTNLTYEDTGEDPFSFDFRYGGILMHLGVAF